MEKKYDVVVIGAGPAGYVAAIRCAQLGLHTACVDEWIDADGKQSLGGTCLNAGCIPSKALLETSSEYATLKQGTSMPGIGLRGVSLDLAAVMEAKAKIVSELTSGIASLFRTNKIDAIAGRAQLLPDKQLAITTSKGGKQQVLNAEHIIIATGSRPVDIPAAPQDGKLIVDSEGALAFDKVPKRLGVIGAGVIGLEMGSVWSRFGSEVMLLEAQDIFLPPADRDIASLALIDYRKQGLDIRLDTRVMHSETKRDKVIVTINEAGNTHDLEFDKLVVAVGRRPFADELAPDETGLLTDEGGYIHVDEQWGTSLPQVYAIGDVIRGPMLAHKGSAEGVAVAELIAGQPSGVNYDTIPNIVYTEPEIAWTGRTEQEVHTAGISYKTGRFPFSASGRARAMHRTSGMVKIIADEASDEILGVHIIGQSASELIAEAVLAMEYKATAEDLALTVHGHPTLAEALHEAALAVNGDAIHIANKKRKH